MPVPDGAKPDFHHPKLGDPSGAWSYIDAAGELQGYVCRFETKTPDGGAGKEFRPRRYGTLIKNGSPHTGWYWKGWGENRPLYGLCDLLARPDVPVIVVEGEKKVDAARLLFPDHVAVSPMNGAKSPHRTDWTPLAQRIVVIWPDHDAPGLAFAKAVAELATKAASASIVTVAVPSDWPKGWDLADEPPNGVARDFLAEILTSAKQSSGNGVEKDEAEILRLAVLPEIAYGRERKQAAEKLNLPVFWLDRLVRKKRTDIAAAAPREAGDGAGGQGRAIKLLQPDPWPEPVDGAALLSGLAQAIKRHMVMEPGAAESIALWVVHTHALDAFGITPRLAITSPRPQCGKTTLLDLLFHLVLRPIQAVNVSAASVFRVVEVALPTLLVDEADTFLPNNDELRGVLNSGHRRGGSVIRVVGEAMEVREFSTWAPAAIAMIGTLPGTLADRSVAIALKRKRADETVESFRYDQTNHLDCLARMCARWGADNIELLRAADPAVPENLYNRAADNWRPLLAIADAAGAEWPAAARKIAAATVDADQVKRIGLLADIRAVFDTKGVDRLKSADLAAALAEMEGHPWAEHGKTGKPLSVNGLARMLAGDRISPNTIRFGLRADDNTAKGYLREQFEDAFTRYLPLPPIATVTPSPAQDFCGFQPDSQPSPVNTGYGSEDTQNPLFSAAGDGVTVENQGRAPESARKRFKL
jgi:putative DNA primase/helicase